MLKIWWIPIGFLIVIVVLSAALFYIMGQSQQDFNLKDDTEIVFQVSAFKPFAQGDFSGKATYAELGEHGNFGIGTLTGLDGEMVGLNGVFYQIPINGEPRQISSFEETPFAIVTFFDVDKTLYVSDSLNFSEIQAYIDECITPENAIYAIKIQGIFTFAKTRSVPEQIEPYPTLYDVVTNQVMFSMNNVVGTMVGFRFPSYMDEINVPGYHFHFISEDESFGGHLLDCIVKNAVIEIDYTFDYELALPEFS